MINRNRKSKLHIPSLITSVMLILFGIFAFFIKYDYVIVLIMYNGLAGLVIFYGIHILLFCIIDYIRCRKEINNVVNG